MPMPLLIAHRGESYDAPENTHAAFDLAWERGDDAIELDVHVTADGEVVVCHDADTLRTGGEKLVIKDVPFAALRSIDVGRWKGKKWSNVGIPRLSEVLSRTPAGKKVFVEIKPGVGSVDAIASLFRQPNLTAGEVSFLSFHLDVIRQIKQQLPSYKTYYLANSKHETPEPTPSLAAIAQTARSAGATGVDLEDGPWPTAPAVRELHDAGLEVIVWTVDNPTRSQELTAIGVDAITTNRANWMGEQIF